MRPGDLAIAQAHAVGLADEKGGCVVGFDILHCRRRAVVELGAGVFRPTIQRDGNLLEPDVANAAGVRSADPNAVLALAAHVADANIVNRADRAAFLRGTAVSEIASPRPHHGAEK